MKYETKLYRTASTEVEDYFKSAYMLLESRRRLSRFLIEEKGKEGNGDSIKYSEQLLEYHNEQLRKIFAL